MGEKGRALVVIDAASPVAAAARVRDITRPFICVIAWDSQAASIEELSVLTGALVDLNVVQVSVWGSGCERLHDVLDEEFVYADVTGRSARTVLTTWHDHETLEDVLWFVRNTPAPDGASARSDAIVGIAIDQPAWARRMRNVLSGQG